MRHLDDGTLRRLVDDPAAISDSLQRHYASCDRCHRRYTEVFEDADAVSSMMSLPAVGVDSGSALHLLQKRIAIAETKSRSVRAPSLRRPAIRVRSSWRPAFATVGTLGILAIVFTVTPASSLAQNVLSVFQPSQVQSLQTTSAELASLRGLRVYGDLSRSPSTGATSVSNAAAASSASGMSVLVPDPSLSGVPASAATYSVIPASSQSFTFDAAKAQQHASSTGTTMPPMPAGLDGSTLTVSVGTTVLTQYSGQSSELPQLVIGQMTAPKVSSSGVPLAEMENYVLSLPGVSPTLAAEIRSLGDASTTLPIPIPVDLANSRAVEVQGVHGVEVGDNTGLGAGVIWEKDGIVYAVGGTLTESQAVAIAQSLR